jgi:hypothetical protein
LTQITHVRGYATPHLALGEKKESSLAIAELRASRSATDHSSARASCIQTITAKDINMHTIPVTIGAVLFQLGSP